MTSHWQSGIAVLNDVTIKSGTGQIVLDGDSTAGTTTNYSWNAGINMNAGNGDTVRFYSASNTHPAISLDGKGGQDPGIQQHPHRGKGRVVHRFLGQ